MNHERFTQHEHFTQLQKKRVHHITRHIQALNLMNS